MRIAVTGAGGFIGSAVMRRGLAAGHDMRGWRRPYEPWSIPIGAEAVIHCAWDSVQRDDNTIQEISAFWARKCLAAAADYRLRQVPSIPRRWVGVGSQAEIFAETPYGRMKRLAQRRTMHAAMYSKLSWAWARFWSVYGPGGHGIITNTIQAIRRGEALKLDACDQPWDLLYVDDAADALLALATTDAPGVFDVAYNGEVTPPLRTTIFNIATRLKRRGGVGPKITFGRRRGKRLPTPDTRWLRIRTGWSPQVTLREGLDRTVKGTP